MKALWITLVTGAVLSFGQATNKKAIPPAAKPDTWQKSKECAAQSEKLVGEWDRDGLSKGVPKTVWTNHYSPKYNRCFLQTFDAPANKPSGRRTTLMDAFERSSLAELDFANQFCQIEFQDAPCGKVADFISEHMKN